MTLHLPSAETPTNLTSSKNNSHHHSSFEDIYHQPAEACVGFSQGDPIELASFHPSHAQVVMVKSVSTHSKRRHRPRVEFSLYIQCSNSLCSSQTNHSRYINPVRRNRNELECGDHHHIKQRCLKIFRIRWWCLFPISQASTSMKSNMKSSFLGCLEPNERTYTNEPSKFRSDRTDLNQSRKI